MSDLIKRIEWLEKCLGIASRFVSIKKCKSCKNPYASGYVCCCGRDNTYSDMEWDEREVTECH